VGEDEVNGDSVKVGSDESSHDDSDSAGDVGEDEAACLDLVFATHTPPIDRSAFPPVKGIRMQKQVSSWQVWFPGAENPASERWRWFGLRPSRHRVATEKDALQKCADFCWRWHKKLGPQP